VDSEGVERKLAAILSADAVGYSRLLAEHEVSTVRRLTAYREEIGLLVQQHRGRVVDAPGDNLLAEFPSASEAVRCAVEVQRVVAARNADLDRDQRLEFRIGIHMGEVMVEAERIYGDGVNIAARLERLAEPGGICVSGTVHEQVHAKLSPRFEDLGSQSIKNIPHPVRVYRLHWQPETPAGAQAGGAGAPDLGGLSGRPDVAVFVVPAIWVVYVAIGFEILFMISPFALYYYSSYGPSLNFLHASPWTAWLTQFFLPHFSQTASPVLNSVRPLGMLLVFGGLLLFLVGFVQIYWAKLRRREAVVGGLYRRIRHPQYLALAIVGLGTLFVWPRFLVLVAYVTMLFLYVLLARFEEQQCLRKFGASYRDYMERTGMFLPGRLFRRFPALLPASGGARVAAALALYVAVLAIGIGVAYRLRDYSLEQVSAVYEERLAALSPAMLSDAEIEAALRVAMAGAEVRDRLDSAARDARLLVYVIPLDWELPDLPLERGESLRGHHTPGDFDRRLYKVLFTRVRTHDPGIRGEAIVKQAYGRDPIVLARVNSETREITGVETPPPHVRWGDIPPPMF
jgi:class 3 adenylate cyclase/protein-S-isoprenylcysteine O-methyltransferase Ste14